MRGNGTSNNTDARREEKCVKQVIEAERRTKLSRKNTTGQPVILDSGNEAESNGNRLLLQMVSVMRNHIYKEGRILEVRYVHIERRSHWACIMAKRIENRMYAVI